MVPFVMLSEVSFRFSKEPKMVLKITFKWFSKIKRFKKKGSTERIKMLYFEPLGLYKAMSTKSFTLEQHTPVGLYPAVTSKMCVSAWSVED